MELSLNHRPAKDANQPEADKGLVPGTLWSKLKERSLSETSKAWSCGYINLTALIGIVSASGNVVRMLGCFLYPHNSGEAHISASHHPCLYAPSLDAK